MAITDSQALTLPLRLLLDASSRSLGCSKIQLLTDLEGTGACCCQMFLGTDLYGSTADSSLEDHYMMSSLAACGSDDH